MEKVKKFTDAMVRNIKAPEQRTEYTEGNGFILRVSPSGVKSWVYYFKFEGKPYRFTMGRYPALSVADAREKAGIAGALKDKGINPIQNKKDTEANQQWELQTFGWLAEDFYSRYVLKNRKVPAQIRQQLDADIIPLLGSRKIDEITTRMITLELEKIVDRGSPVHANKVLATIKQIFTYGMSKGITDSNPALVIKSKNIGGVTLPRNRHLTYEEIKLIWTYFSDRTKHNIHPATIAGLKILLLTGVRTGSLIKAEFKEIDFDNDIWTIPAEHLKLKKTELHKPHKIHLTGLAKELFKELQELSGGRYVLPAMDNSRRANDKLFSKIVSRSRGKIEGITEDYNVHDFRATFSTHLAELGTAPHITELCLGHKLPTIMATYNKHEYLPERKEALEQWSNKIKALITNTNVVMLDRSSNE